MNIALCWHPNRVTLLLEQNPQAYEHSSLTTKLPLSAMSVELFCTQTLKKAPKNSTLWVYYPIDMLDAEFADRTRIFILLNSLVKASHCTLASCMEISSSNMDDFCTQSKVHFNAQKAHSTPFYAPLNAQKGHTRPALSMFIGASLLFACIALAHAVLYRNDRIITQKCAHIDAQACAHDHQSTSEELAHAQHMQEFATWYTQWSTTASAYDHFCRYIQNIPAEIVLHEYDYEINARGSVVCCAATLPPLMAWLEQPRTQQVSTLDRIVHNPNGSIEAHIKIKGAALTPAKASLLTR
ncbi:MAG: hypothetical protein UU47_C0004G0016 [candidate division TM6 bacterium GW2011_GWE2_41_16]|nr:MAG: hypothetical protein UU47_C0004G0016 [candidate division TM6 bacterium GW2011_GWE2_41_16]